MEATQAFSLTNVCEGGDECNTGERSEEPHNVKGERCDRPGGEVRPTECVFVCAVDFAVHVRCVLSAVGARCAVLRCAVLVRCAVCGASHFQGMLNKKHKQPRARSAEPAPRCGDGGAWRAGASPVPPGIVRSASGVRAPRSCALPSPVYGQCGGRASLTLYKWLQTSANLGNVRPVTSASVPRPLSVERVP